MSAAATLLDWLGRPGTVRLGSVPAQIGRLSTGLSVLDAATGGGLPRGRLVELAGPRSAGSTGVACRIAAQTTASGEVIAWVDTEDALDPAAMDRAGVVLARLLWVRPRLVPDALRAADLLLRAGGFGLVVLDLAAGLGRNRVDPALWPRFVRSAEHSRTTLLVIAPMRLAGTFAALGLETSARVRWSGGAGRLTLLEGMDVHVAVVRNRIGRPDSARLVAAA